MFAEFEVTVELSIEVDAALLLLLNFCKHFSAWLRS